MRAPGMTRWGLVAVALAGLAACAAQPPARAALDLGDAADNLSAWVKMRGDLSGADTVTWWQGQVFAAVPGEKPKLLFGFEGLNVARFEPLPGGGFRMLSREYAVYRDPVSGAILKDWQNPWTGTTVPVFHVQNDPVNHDIGVPTADGHAPRLLPMREHGGDVIVGLDVPLAYPNPIPPERWPEHSSGPLYVGSEHFGFYARKAELDDPRRSSVPISIAWFREGPWLPWMRMGQRPGLLIYSGYGKKLIGGVAELPAEFRAHLEAEAPRFLSAPREYVQPNATTWTVYRKAVLEAGEAR